MTDSSQASIRVLKMPWSEACMHMRLQDKVMIGQLVGTGSDEGVQLYSPGGKQWSTSITPGEAGWNQQTGVVELPEVDTVQLTRDLAQTVREFFRAEGGQAERLDRRAAVQLFALANALDLPALANDTTNAQFSLKGRTAVRAIRAVASETALKGEPALGAELRALTTPVLRPELSPSL